MKKLSVKLTAYQMLLLDEYLQNATIQVDRSNPVASMMQISILAELRLSVAIKAIDAKHGRKNKFTLNVAPHFAAVLIYALSAIEATQFELMEIKEACYKWLLNCATIETTKQQLKS